MLIRMLRGHQTDVKDLKPIRLLAWAYFLSQCDICLITMEIAYEKSTMFNEFNAMYDSVYGSIVFES